jgi:hypothetical protein
MTTQENTYWDLMLQYEQGRIGGCPIVALQVNSTVFLYSHMMGEAKVYAPINAIILSE